MSGRLDRQWLRRVSQLRPWARTGRSPHKPLLLLTYLAKLQNGSARLLPYSEIRDDLALAIEEFAPSGRRNPHYPWKRLSGDDGLWEIPAEADMPLTGSGDVHVGWLRAHDPQAGIPERFFDRLRNSSMLLDRTVRLLLGMHFPPSLWGEVVDATKVAHDLEALIDIGIDLPSAGSRRRDPAFRPRVLAAYKGRCGVCGYNGTRRGLPVGLEAAHIRWHTHDGPDDVENGIGMCSLHHVLFDRGMFTYTSALELMVSPRFVASGRTFLHDHAGTRLIVGGGPPPANKFLRWHRQQVFKESV